MTHRKDAVAGSIVLLVVMTLMTSAAGAAGRGATDACTGTTLLATTDGARAGAVGAILCLVNRERTRRGLAAVRLSPQLSQSATAFSEDMAQRKFFGHVSPDGSNLRQRIGRTGYLRSASYVAETLAWASDELATPAELVRALMGSPGHKRVILDGRFRDIGVGLATGVPDAETSGDGATLTLDFGRR
jgi:uncharacterized protein YkwD